MKTTLVIDDQVMRRLKQEAARQKCTMSYLVEAALRLMLDARQQKRPSRDPICRTAQLWSHRADEGKVP